MKRPLLSLSIVTCALAVLPWTVRSQSISLNHLSTYSSGTFDEGAAEIAGFHANSQRIFFTNADANTVDVLDASNPGAPVFLFSIDLSPYGGGVNSVVVLGDENTIAIAVEAHVKQDPGTVVFFDTDGTYLNHVTVGALPDMVTVTPDGTKLVTANEGEPNDDYTVDPEGSVSVIDISGGILSAAATTISFAPFNPDIAALQASGVRIYGPGATVAQDLEPEYVVISEDSQTAYVILQENNAMAIVNLTLNTVSSIKAFGTKDHSLPGNELDASNKDGAINITNWPVKGFYMPDGADLYTVGGQSFIVTANEGDSRDYDGYSEEERVKDLELDSTVYADSTLQEDENLGRIKTTTAQGDIDGDGDVDQIYTYGARSFSIWDAAGNLVWDSGNQFETILAAQLPADFNSTNDENDSFDNRSDDKGPEPEAVEIAEISGRMFAFIGLERVGGIMVYDISNPYAPTFIQYINNRDFSGDLEANGTDSGVEGLVFVSEDDSPNGNALLISSNEVSGTVSIFEINNPFCETYYGYSGISVCHTFTYGCYVYQRSYCTSAYIADLLVNHYSGGYNQWTYGDCTTNVLPASNRRTQQTVESYDGTEYLNMEEYALLFGEMSWGVYPNPSTGEHLNLQIENIFIGMDQVDVTIMDLSGRVVLTDHFDTHGMSTLNTPLSLNEALSSGTYIVTINTGNQVLTQKLMINQ